MIKSDVEEFVKSLDLEQLRALAALVQAAIVSRQGDVAESNSANFVFLDHELQHIRSGHPVQAVKSVRDRTGLSLDVCRNLVATSSARHTS